VSFCDEEVELFEAFTPYARVYGEHPSGFVFDGNGHMVQAGAETSMDMSTIDVGAWLECNAACGVGYRNQPHFTARFDDLRTLEFGDRVKVAERSGEWIRDEVGWLPLWINGMPVFEKACVNSPSRPGRRKISKSRCSVMIADSRG